MKSYQTLCTERNNIISENRARRMRPNDNRPSLPIPSKPQKPMGYQIFINGTFEGFHPIDNKNDAIQAGIIYAKESQPGPIGNITVKRVESING